MERPELDIFVEYTPKLANTTYGSDEYKEHLQGMRKGLKHHYKINSHHPEHYNNGINGMCLLDLIEMLSDWKAATERHADGDIIKSLEINKERFGISDQLYEVLLNTVEKLKWWLRNGKVRGGRDKLNGRPQALTIMVGVLF